MATIQEIIAKRAELQKTNPNATNIDARKALMPTTTPTATETPTAPTPTNPHAPTVTGIEGQKFTQAPIDPTTGLSRPLETPAPLTMPKGTQELVDTNPVNSPATKVEVAGITTPTTTPEVKPTEIKPTTNYNTSVGREAEIQKNISDITATNKSLLKDRNAYNQAFGYDTADEGKKAILDSSFQSLSMPIDTNSIFTSLKSGVSVPVSNTPEYRQAVNRYNNFKKFSTYDEAQITTAINNGTILPGTTTYNDLVSDQAVYQKILKAQAYNKGTVDIVKTGESQTSYVMSNNPTVASALSDGYLSANEYNQLTNNSEVSGQAKVVESKKNDYESIKARYDAIEDDIDQEIEKSGKEVPTGFRDKLVADRRKGMYKELTIATNEYQNALGTYTELKNSSTKLLEMNMNLYQQKQAEQAQIAQEQRQIQSQKDMLQYQADFNKKQAELALNDPATAIKSVMDEYKKLGIPFTSTVKSRLAEFKASGKPLEQFLTEMSQNIQASPAYKKYQELQQGQMSDAQKIQASQAFDLNKMGIEQNFQMKLAQAKQTTNNKWTKLDDGLYTNDSGEIITANELKDVKLLNNSYINKETGADGGDCGFFASRGTGMSATPGGNSKEKRFSEFSDKTPQVGGMAFFGGEGYDKTYGHIAIVTGVNSDGTITVKDSNYGNDGKVQVRTVPASSVSGYYNNTPLAKSFNKGEEITTSDDLTSVLKSGKLGEGQKTNVAKIQGVIQAIDTFAKNNASGDIAGVSPGISFDMFSSADSIENRGYLDTMNLIVQQWASGASLTEAQIKQVNKLVPGEYDTDSVVKAKLNNLKNFMNDQVKSTLNVSGITYNPSKSDLWKDSSKTNDKISEGASLF